MTQCHITWQTYIKGKILPSINAKFTLFGDITDYEKSLPQPTTLISQSQSSITRVQWQSSVTRLQQQSLHFVTICHFGSQAFVFLQQSRYVPKLLSLDLAFISLEKLFDAWFKNRVEPNFEGWYRFCLHIKILTLIY